MILDNLLIRLYHESESIITSNLNKLSQLSNSLKYNNPEQLIKYKEQYFNETKLKLTHVAQNIIIKKNKN